MPEKDNYPSRAIFVFYSLSGPETHMMNTSEECA